MHEWVEIDDLFELEKLEQEGKTWIMYRNEEGDRIIRGGFADGVMEVRQYG